MLIIPVGPNNNVADVQYEEVGTEAEGLVPRRREGVNESWKLNEKYGNVLCLAVTPNGHSSMSKDPRDYFKAKYSEGMQLAWKWNDRAGQNEITISTQICLSNEVRPNDYNRAIIRTLSQAQAVKWELINILVNEEEEIKIAEIYIDCLEVDTCTASHYIESPLPRQLFQILAQR